MPRSSVKPVQVGEKRPTPKQKIREIIKKPKEKFLTKSQEEYWNIIEKNEITICNGVAGTGKSYISMKKGLDLLWEENNKYEKIIIVRPAVEAGTSIGLLPGTVDSKIEQYILPSYYLIKKIIGSEALESLRNEHLIESFPLSFLRGWNIDNAILIVEELQNMTVMELKLVLTRIGFNSKFILSGDIDQSDKFKNKKESALFFAKEKLNDLKGVGFFEFKPEDIVRNPLISEIIKRFD